MKILKLGTVRNKYEMRDAGYKKVVRTLNDQIIQSPESYINTESEELNVVMFDVRGEQVELLIPFNKLITLYRLLKDQTLNNGVYPIKEYKKIAKPNAINIKVDENGLATVTPEKTKLEFPVFTNPTKMGQVIMQVNGEYIVLAQDKEFFVLHRINFIDCLISAQAHLGLAQLELQSMSFELTENVRSYDADVITYGNSTIFYSNNKLFVIQEELMKHALMIRHVEPSRRKFKLYEVNEEEYHLYKGLTEMEEEELTEQSFIVYIPVSKSLAPKVYVPIKTLISIGFTANTKNRTVRPMMTVIRITNRITRTIDIEEYLSKEQLLKDEAYNEESKYLQMTGGM